MKNASKIFYLSMLCYAASPNAITMEEKNLSEFQNKKPISISETHIPIKKRSNYINFSNLNDNAPQAQANSLPLKKRKLPILIAETEKEEGKESLTSNDFSVSNLFSNPENELDLNSFEDDAFELLVNIRTDLDKKLEDSALQFLVNIRKDSDEKTNKLSEKYEEIKKNPTVYKLLLSCFDSGSKKNSNKPAQLSKQTNQPKVHKLSESSHCLLLNIAIQLENESTKFLKNFYLKEVSETKKGILGASILVLMEIFHGIGEHTKIHGSIFRQVFFNLTGCHSYTNYVTINGITNRIVPPILEKNKLIESEKEAKEKGKLPAYCITKKAQNLIQDFVLKFLNSGQHLAVISKEQLERFNPAKNCEEIENVYKKHKETSDKKKKTPGTKQETLPQIPLTKPIVEIHHEEEINFSPKLNNEINIEIDDDFKIAMELQKEEDRETRKLSLRKKTFLSHNINLIN